MPELEQDYGNSEPERRIIRCEDGRTVVVTTQWVNGQLKVSVEVEDAEPTTPEQTAPKTN